MNSLVLASFLLSPTFVRVVCVLPCSFIVLCHVSVASFPLMFSCSFARLFRLFVCLLVCLILSLACLFCFFVQLFFSVCLSCPIDCPVSSYFLCDTLFVCFVQSFPPPAACVTVLSEPIRQRGASSRRRSPGHEGSHGAWGGQGAGLQKPLFQLR